MRLTPGSEPVHEQNAERGGKQREVQIAELSFRRA
jgi:hypothetical protein